MKPNSFLNISRKILKAYNRQCEKLLERYDIPQVSFDILMFLCNNPEFKTAHEISEIRHIKKNLVSVHVEKLVAAGMLERAPIEGDRRKIALVLTDKAEPIINDGRIMQESFFSTLTDGIDEEMWNTFEKMNLTLEYNVERILKNK